MIYTWMADIEKLEDEKIYKRYYEKVPCTRKKKADRYRFAKDRAQSVGAWVLLEKMRLYYGIDESCVFNLSHSGRYAMCSLADSKDVMVGCDIEMLGKYKGSLAKHFFAKEEYEQIERAKTEEEKCKLFYRYWVWKESFMKATRLGMKLDLNTFAFALHEGEVVFTKKPERYAQDFFVKEYKVKERDAMAAVCSDRPDFCEEICTLKFQ